MFNSSINVYKTEWLDLVFSGRNKKYGAYVLRSQSSSILTKALFIASSCFVLVFIAPIIYGKLFPAPAAVTVTAHDLPTLVDAIHQMKKTDEPKKAEPEKTEPVKVKTVAMPSKIVVVDEVDLPEPPTVKDIQDAVVSSKTQDGEIKPNFVASTNTNGDGKDKGNESVPGTGNEVVELPGVDEYPEFEGGMKGWAKYIQRNLHYPYMAQELNTQGKVFLSFVVEKDGSITNVTLVKGIGAGCDEEAIRVIKKSPLWKPGKNKGNAVRVRYNLPINFTISN